LNPTDRIFDSTYEIDVSKANPPDWIVFQFSLMPGQAEVAMAEQGQEQQIRTSTSVGVLQNALRVCVTKEPPAEAPKDTTIVVKARPASAIGKTVEQAPFSTQPVRVITGDQPQTTVTLALEPGPMVDLEGGDVPIVALNAPVKVRATIGGGNTFGRQLIWSGVDGDGVTAVPDPSDPEVATVTFAKAGTPRRVKLRVVDMGADPHGRTLTVNVLSDSGPVLLIVGPRLIQPYQTTTFTADCRMKRWSGGTCPSEAPYLDWRTITWSLSTDPNSQRSGESYEVFLVSSRTTTISASGQAGRSGDVHDLDAQAVIRSR